MKSPSTSDNYVMSLFGEGALRVVQKQGFRLPPRPDDHLELPSDLSAVANEQLVQLMAGLTAWADYAHAQLGLAQIAEREAQREVDNAEAAVLAGLPKATVTVQKAMVTEDPDVKSKKTNLDRAYAYRHVVQSLAARYDRDVAVLSRELTRRTHDAPVVPSRRWSEH